MSVIPSLIAVQAGLKAPKDQKANRYRYRNIEDINEAVKPLAAKNGCAVIYTDTYETVGDRLICVSRCTLVCDDGEAHASGFAIVNADSKNMSVEQACGAASSYARKYAACGLFAIDDSENDPDARQEKPRQDNPRRIERNEAITRLYAAMGRFADSSGTDIESLKQGIKKRPDYEDTAEFYNRVADEFEAA